MATKQQNQIKGYINKKNGAQFEGFITAACEYYKKQGIAFIDKTPEPVHYVKPYSGNTFVAYYEHSAQPDYKGILSNGQTICFDAKLTTKDRILRSALLDDQLAYLHDIETFGGLSYVFVSFDFQRYFLVPFKIWENMKELYGRKYLKPDDISEYEVKMSPRLYLLFCEQFKNIK